MPPLGAATCPPLPQSESSLVGKHGNGGDSASGDILLPSAALGRRVSSALNLAAGEASLGGGPASGPSSGASSKRNSCNCRKCSIFSLEDCEPKEVNSVIKYLRFRKVRTNCMARVGWTSGTCS